MKNFIKSLIFLLILFQFNLLYSQFSEGYHKAPFSHFVHNSIAKSQIGSNFYAVASTVDDGAGNTSIYVSKIDANGVLVWEKEVNTGGLNAKALDVLVDNTDEILVVGYIESGHRDLYVAKFSTTGTLLVDYSMLQGNNVGTCIIQSQFSNNYYIGGYLYDTELPYDMVGTAFLLELDNTLGFSHWQREYSGSNVNNTISEILELPNQNLFITGSIGQNQTGQSILAAIVDPLSSGAFVSGGNLGFNVAQDYSLGASAVYDASTDEIWLLLNAGVDSRPIIASIDNATTSTPFLSTTARELIIPNSPGDNYLAYDMILSPVYPNGLSIFGYKDYTTLASSEFGIWAVDVDRTSGAMNTDLKAWDPIGTNTISIEYQGGSVLGLFSNVNPATAPYFHSPSMAVEDHGGNRFVLLGMDDRTGFTEYDVMSFNNDVDQFSSNCLSELKPHMVLINTFPTTINDELISYPDLFPGWTDLATISNPLVYCNIAPFVPSVRSSGNTTSTSEKDNVIVPKSAVKVYPNPTQAIVNLKLEGKSNLSSITVINNLGKVVYSKSVVNELKVTEIDMSNFSNGIYFVRITDSENSTFTERVIKQ